MSARRLFEVLFAVSLFTITIRATLDPDMWWHLRTGQVILDTGIPRQDIFSYTVPDHRWITHEWLSEVIMWLVFQAVRLPGLILFFGVITAYAYWLVYMRTDGRPYLAAFVVLLAALASAPFWGVRPQIFNIFFTAVFVFLVEGFRDGQVSRKMLWLLPVSTILWANLHSGYLLGVILLSVYVVGDGAQLVFGSYRRRVLNWQSVRWLALMMVLSFLAAALNPNGEEMWIYPFFTLGSQAMQRYIQEWQSPNFHLPMFWPFAVMLVLGVAGFLSSRQRPTLTDVILFGGTAAAGLLSSRHIPLFAVVSAPIIARRWLIVLDGTRLYPLLSGRLTFQNRPGLAFLNWLLLLAAIIGAGLWIYSKVNQNNDAITDRYPEAAVDFLEKEGLSQQRGYNSYNWGGYLIWRGIPVFVDGRADVYGDDFLYYYRRTYDMTSRWRDPLDDYDVEYVIIEHASPLSNLLSASGAWQQAYDDSVASVYVRTE